MDYIQTYLAIQQIRFGSRLNYRIKIAKGLDLRRYKILPLLIQPIVENAISHGLKDKDDDGRIIIKISRSSDELLVADVFDNGSGMSSRLFKNLRDKDGLAYQLGSQYAPNILKGSFIVYIGTNPQNLDYATKRLQEEVFRLKTEFVGTKELQEAKDKLLGNYIISQETNLDKATTIGWFETSGRGYQFNDEYVKLINSVTESDIIEVANKYFNNNYVLSIVKP